MSQTGIEKSRGTLILGLIDRHRHTTDRCTNPTNTEKKRLHRTRESLGFEIISTNSPSEGQGGGRAGGEKTRSTTHHAKAIFFFFLPKYREYIAKQLRR